MSKLGSIHTLALHSEQQGNKGLKFKLNNHNHRNSVFVYFNPLHPLAHPNPMHSDRRQRGEGQAAKQVANCFEKDFVIRIAMNIAMSITLPFRRPIAIIDLPLHLKLHGRLQNQLQLRFRLYFCY